VAIVNQLVSHHDKTFPVVSRRAGVATIMFLFLLVGSSLIHAQATRTQQSEQILQPGGDTVEHDTFGTGVAISGNTMVIGAENADGNEVGAGAAFIFDKIDDNWVQTARIFAADGHAQPVPSEPGKFESDSFGLSVAISGDTVVVGAPDHIHPGIGGPSARVGAVYVFQRLNGVWTQRAELFSPNPNVHDNFGGQQGNSLAGGVGISGDTIVVADAGNFQFNNIFAGIDVFNRINGTWTFTTQLTVPADFSFFPNSLAFDGKTLVVGSNISDTLTAPFAGVAYVFQFNDGQWSAPMTLAADDATSGAQFGNGVGLSGNLIVVGANFAPGATSQSGAAYIFTHEGDSWRQKAKLISNDGQDFDQFGVTIAVSGQTVLVSASNHTPPVADATEGGAAYVFRHRDGGWQQADELFASDAIGGGDFGASVAIQDNTLIVGADGQHPPVEGYPGGEAYVFRLNPE